jgi:hypothetical protein
MWTADETREHLFFKVSAGWLRAVRALRLSGTAREILDELAFQVGSVPCPEADLGVAGSVRLFAQKLGRARSSVEKALAELREKGVLLRRLHEHGHGRMRYHLAHPSTWGTGSAGGFGPEGPAELWGVPTVAPTGRRGPAGRDGAVPAGRDGGVAGGRVEGVPRGQDGRVRSREDAGVPERRDAVSRRGGTATRGRGGELQSRTQSRVHTSRRDEGSKGGSGQRRGVWELWVAHPRTGERVPLPRVAGAIRAELGELDPGELPAAVQQAICERGGPSFTRERIAEALAAAPAEARPERRPRPEATPASVVARTPDRAASLRKTLAFMEQQGLGSPQELRRMRRELAELEQQAGGGLPEAANDRAPRLRGAS